MLAIPSKVLNDFDKYVHYSFTNNLVFEVNRFEKPILYTNIFKYEYCADLYLSLEKIYVNENNEKIVPINENNMINFYIKDIFMIDENNILSIPYDNELTIQDFIDNNKSFFKPIYVSPIRPIFSIFIIDSNFLHKK